LRIWSDKFQVVLLQEQADDDGLLRECKLHSSAFVQAAAEPDEGKPVLAVFGAPRRKAQGVIGRWLPEHLW
jgi:hypothetical protein